MMRNTLNQALLHTSAKPFLWLLCLSPLASLVGQLLLNALGPNPAEALIRSTGDWALRALCVALAVTPLRLFSGLTGLARMRRLLGLFAFFYALLHSVSYAGLDMEWKWASIWGDVLQRPFVLAGLLAMVVLLLLALTSPKAMLKAMGAPRWQRLHRTVYVAAWLAVLHFYWMRLGKNNLTEVFYYGFILFLLLFTRIYFYCRKNFTTKLLNSNK